MTTQPNLQVNEELAQAIVTLYQTQDQAQRQTIKEQLDNLEQDIEKHVQNCFALIIDASNPVVQEHKKSFAIYLKNFFDQILRDFNSSFDGGAPTSHDQINQRIYLFSEMLLQVFLSPTLQLHIKSNFTSILARLMRMSKNYDLDQNKATHSNYLNTLIIPVVQGLQSNQFETQCGAIAFCESVLRNLTLNNIDQSFLALSSALCQVAELHLAALKNDFAQVQQQIANKEEIASTNPIADSMTGHLKVLKSWVAMHKRLLDADDQETSLLTLRFSRSEVYSTQMTLLLSLSALDTPEHTQSIVSFTGLQKLDQMINQIKTDNIICINRILQFVYSKVSSAQRKNVPFIPKMVQFAQPLVQSLVLVTKRPDLEALCEEEIYADILIEMLAMVVIFSGEKEFYDIIHSMYKPILISICLNFLKTMKSEAETMEDNPQDFVNLALDTCDKQQSETIKTNAAKLLESMCDNIDGAVSNITIFCCAAINTALQGAPVQPEQLLNMQDDPFLHNQPEIIAETCIVAMTVISYILPRRKDLVPIFEETLAANIDKILSVDSVLLRARLSLLLGYYADMLFSKQPVAFKKSMNFLYSSVGLDSQREHVIALQSCDTLNTIVQDDDLMPRLAEMLGEIVQTINQLITSVKVVTFFEFVQEFVKMYKNLLAEQYIVTIVQSLVIRVNNEQKQTEKNLPIINKTWNCIRAIVEIDAYIKPHYVALEDSLKPLFEFMVNPSQITFDEDIVLVIKSFIKKSKSVSPTMWTLFPLMRNVFDKNKQCLGNLLDTINFYLVYGAETISQNKEYIQSLLTISATSLFTEEPNQTLNNSEGAILMQLMLQILQQYDCLNEFFAEMLDGVVKRMQAKPMVKHLKRQLLGIFMAAMIYNTDATINYMEQKGITTEVVQELINIKSSCQTMYERKLMVCGMTKLVSCSVLPESMRPLIGQVIQQIIQTLLQQKKIEAQEHKKRAIKEVRVENDDDEDDDESDDEDEDDEDDSDLDEENNEGADEKMEDNKEGGEESLGFANNTNDNDEELKDDDQDDTYDDDMDEVFDLNMSLDMLSTPIKKEDEFKLFGSTIKQIHQRSPQDFGQIVSCFSDKDKEFCKELLQHQRIELVVNGQQQQVARRIIKVKRSAK